MSKKNLNNESDANPDLNVFQVECEGKGVNGKGCPVYIFVQMPKKIPRGLKDPLNSTRLCAFCSAREIESLHTKFDSLSKQLSELKEKTTDTAIEVAKDVDEVKEDIQKVSQGRIFERKRLSVVIYGITPGTSEDIRENYQYDLKMVRKMLKAMSVTETCINYVTRAKTGAKPVILAVNSQLARDMITRKSFENSGVEIEHDNKKMEVTAKPDRTKAERQRRNKLREEREKKKKSQQRGTNEDDSDAASVNSDDQKDGEQPFRTS